MSPDVTPNSISSHGLSGARPVGRGARTMRRHLRPALLLQGIGEGGEAVAILIPHLLRGCTQLGCDLIYGLPDQDLLVDSAGLLWLLFVVDKLAIRGIRARKLRLAR